MNTHLPAELLKIKLNQQLSRLKELLNAIQKPAEEPKFSLYQRLVSWFMMGRLSKAEYDRVLEVLLETTEMIELHNRVLQLIRAIHCDANNGSSAAASNAHSSSLPQFAFNLLAPSEREALIELESVEERPSAVVSTAVKLTQSEEILISEAMRAPVLPLTQTDPQPALIKHRRYFGDPLYRLASELGRLPDGEEMRKRALSVMSDNFGGLETMDEASDETFCDEQAAVLMCKAVEDYLKILIQNAWQLKYNQHARLQPPEPYIFGDDSTSPTVAANGESVQLLNGEDLELVLRVKPSLLADFWPELLKE